MFFLEGEQSSSVNEYIEECTLKQKKGKLSRELEESYKALAEEDREINKEWEIVDLENWDQD